MKDYAAIAAAQEAQAKKHAKKIADKTICTNVLQPMTEGGYSLAIADYNPRFPKFFIAEKTADGTLSRREVELSPEDQAKMHRKVRYVSKEHRKDRHLFFKHSDGGSIEFVFTRERERSWFNPVEKAVAGVVHKNPHLKGELKPVEMPYGMLSESSDEKRQMLKNCVKRTVATNRLNPEKDGSYSIALDRIETRAGFLSVREEKTLEPTQQFKITHQLRGQLQLLQGHTNRFSVLWVSLDENGSLRIVAPNKALELLNRERDRIFSPDGSSEDLGR